MASRVQPVLGVTKTLVDGRDALLEGLERGPLGRKLAQRCAGGVGRLREHRLARGERLRGGVCGELVRVRRVVFLGVLHQPVVVRRGEGLELHHGRVGRAEPFGSELDKLILDAGLLKHIRPGDIIGNGVQRTARRRERALHHVRAARGGELDIRERVLELPEPVGRGREQRLKLGVRAAAGDLAGLVLEPGATAPREPGSPGW